MAGFRDISGRIAEKLRDDGFAWIWRRLKREYRGPTTAIGKRFLSLRLALRRRPERSVPVAAAETLYAFFDLQVAPITFDVMWFVAGADIARREAGLRNIHFVVVPGWLNGLREEDKSYNRVVDEHARRWRLSNIILPVMQLLPAATGFTISSSREEARLFCSTGAKVYPQNYDPEFAMAFTAGEVLAASRRGYPMAVLQPPEDARRRVRKWLDNYGQGRKLITITLRQYDYMHGRNSNMEAWARLAGDLSQRNYAVLFIPDTDQSFGPLPDMITRFPVAAEPAWNVGLRMAFYEAAYLNLGVNSGPLALCFFNPAIRCIMFGLLNTAAPQSTKASMRGHGFALGEDLPFATEFQRWIWEPDSFEVIRRETLAVMARIEASLTVRNGA